MEVQHSTEVAHSNTPLILTRPSLIEDIRSDEALAVLDCDGTLTKKKPKLLIEQFFGDYKNGAASTRKALKDIFKDNAKAKKAGLDPDYENFLLASGDGYAEWLRKLGITRKELMTIIGEWEERRGRGLLAEYSKDVIKTLKARHFKPVMVTGAPYEIAAHIAADLGIEHVFAMVAEVDERGRYTGEILRNTGLGKIKAEICRLLQEARHKILFAMGDTHSDMDLIRPAIEYNGRHDGHGRAIMINPSTQDYRELKKWYRSYLSENKLYVLEGKSTKAVVEDVETALTQICNDNAMTDGRIDMAA